MFSFASKMLNTLMGEGEGGPGVGPPGTQPPPRPQGQVRPPYQQPRPRLQQMSYPRVSPHPSPQPILRESTFSHLPNSHVDSEPGRRFSSGGPEEPNLDLSHLSAEERALIQQVMAKAKDLDTTQAPMKPDNQFHNVNSKPEEVHQGTFNMQSGNYGPSQNMSFHQENFPESPSIHKPQETFHQGNNMFQSNTENFSQHKESIPYSSENFQKPTDNFQDISSNLNQRLDNYQMKQEIQSLQDNFSSNQRKEFSLQRQESYNSTKPSSSYFNNSCWEGNEKDEVSRPGNIQQQDCEYSTPSPVSNSPEIRLSPSSPPASPSSEDSRTSLLATSKDEMKPHLPMESFYDHSPGEVYTIPEEEDEISSPTSDGVTSLRKRRLVGAQNIHKENGSSPSTSLQSNHFRSNNNFNILNQNSLKSNTSFGQIGGDLEKSNGNNISSQDSYSSPLRQNDFMSDTKRTSNLGENRYQSQFLDKHPEINGTLLHNIGNDSLANKHELMEKHFQSTSSIRPQLNEHQIQHQILHGTSQQTPEHTTQQQHLQMQQQQQHISQQQHHLQQQPQQQPTSLLHQQHQQQQQQQQQHQIQSHSLQQQQQHSLQQQQLQPQQHLHQQQQQHLHQQQLHQQQSQPFSQTHHLQQQQQQQQQIQSQQSLVQQQQQQQQQIQQNQSYNLQHANPQLQQQPGNPNNQQLTPQTQLQNQLEKKTPQVSQQLQQNQIQMQQPNLQQQMHRQQELQYLQMKKLQHLQRQQLHSRVNSRTPLLQQNKQNIDNNFQMMKSEAGFYGHEESWRGYNEFPDEISLQQFYGKDFNLEHPLNQQKSRQERALGYQKEMDIESFNLQKQNSQQNNAQAKSSAGTISGMLADFSRALGLGNTSDEKSQEEQSSHASDLKEGNQSQAHKAVSQQQIQAQIRANEQFIHGQQSLDYQSAQQSQMSLDSKQLRNQSDTKLQSNVFSNQQFQPIDYNQLQANQQIQAFNQQNLIQQQKQQNALKDDFLNSLDSEQKAMYIQQQLYQKLPEYQPMFAQNLTPQQQQMYQQHMQLQHHAQHLKKIKRSLPQSALDQQRQGQIQKKENNLNMMNQGLGTGVTIQQMMAAQFLGQQPIHPMQLMNSQIVGSDMKISSQSRLVSGSNPVLVASGLTSQQLNSATPMGTPQSTPVGTPRGTRDGGDSSDTMSETDSQKSLRTRRKLPSIPSDQEAITLPNSKKRDGRVKAKSPHDKFSRSYSPLRFPEGGYRISSSNLMLQRPSSSETNLRKISNFGPDTIPRPGSALGLLQGSSVVSSSGMHVDYNRDSELASCLPPDLRYLLHSYKSSDPYAKQQFIQAYKDHMSGEVKLSDRRALNRLSSIDWETERLLNRNKDLLRNPKSRLDIQRKIAYSGIGRTRKLRTHRRQLSDPKIHLEMSPLKDGSENAYNRGYYGVTHPSLRPPYKSYEYESIDDGKLSEWDSSHPYLASYAIAGGALRETAINSVLDKEHMAADPMRYEMRRYSDSLDLRRRDVGKHAKPRSWQPSPYGSDEEDDQLSREQKKAKIKAEIARRRQQIEENARLHEELLRLARLRESAELGYAPLGNTPTLTGDYAMSSVLKSIDDLIGREEYRTPEDRSMDRIASTFRTDDYTSGVYERLTDFSPVTDFSTPHAMPLLPDMPTRSRKLLEDLGSSPITESVLTLPQKE